MTKIHLTACTIDLDERQVVRSGVVHRLTGRELQLLTYLVEHADQNVNRSDLLESVWHLPPDSGSRAVDFTVWRLRQLVEAEPPNPVHLVAVPGVGYRLDIPSEAASSTTTRHVPALRLRNAWVDLDRAEVVRGDDRTPLTPTEFALLRYLDERRGRALTSHELLGGVWGYAGEVRTQTLQSTVWRLRKKIEENPKKPYHIRTVHRVGYRFDQTRDNVPVPSTPMFGREHDAATLERCLDDHRLVTVVGPPGVGKSRLVQQEARRRADEASHEGGVWWIDLAECDHPQAIIDAIGAAMSLALPADVGGSRAIEVVGALLNGLGPALIVLDGLDRASDAGPEVLERWRALAPELRLVVTKREPTHLPGELRLALNPLGEADAAACFADAASRQGARVPPSEPLVRELVQLVDGLPLALQLLALHSGTLGLPTLVELARQGRFGRSMVGTSTHGSPVEEAIRVSWDALTPEDRRCLVQCAVFRQPFDLTAAQAVLDVDNVLDRVHRLAEASLLTVQHPSDGASVQYYLLHVIRSFVREMPEARDVELANRHLEYHLSWLQDIAADGLHADWDGVSEHLADVWAAHDHALRYAPQAAGELLATLDVFVHMRLSHRETVARVPATLSTELPAPVRAALQLRMAEALTFDHQFDEAEALLATTFPTNADQTALKAVTEFLLLRRQGRVEASFQALEPHAEQVQGVSNFTYARVLSNRTLHLCQVGEEVRAEGLARKLLTFSEYPESRSRTLLAAALYEQGRIDECYVEQQLSQRASRTQVDPTHTQLRHLQLARSELALGYYDRAEANLWAARASDPALTASQITYRLLFQGMLDILRDRVPQATDGLRVALAKPGGGLLPYFNNVLGASLQLGGASEEAREAYATAYNWASQANIPSMMAEARVFQASLTLVERGPAAAASVLDEVDQLEISARVRQHAQLVHRRIAEPLAPLPEALLRVSPLARILGRLLD